MKIIYLQRNSLLGFSIKRVFSPIIEILSKKHDVSEVSMKYKTGMPLDIFGNIKEVKKIVKSNTATIFHITGDVHYILLALLGFKSVVTVHDIGLMKSLKNPKRFFYCLIRIKTLKLASRVVFISEYTKNEVLKYVDLNENKIRIIPNSICTSFNLNLKEFNTQRPIILHIGTRPHKNLFRSVKALMGINCHLRIIGKLSAFQIDYLNEYKIDYSNSWDLSDEQILQEYINCDIVNFPSLHEGFGMPIIEGQSIGRVVVTSTIPPMNEVAGQGAVLVNPLDVMELKKAYKKIIENEIFRTSVINEGFKNLNNYTAHKVASCYEELYKSM